MIVQAAVKLQLHDVSDSEIVIPLHRHADIFRILKAFGYLPHKGYTVTCQGFLDEKGNFYNREQAAEHVKSINQKTRNPIRQELFSEDLY